MLTTKSTLLVLLLALPAAAEPRVSVDADAVLWASKGHSVWLGVAPDDPWKVMLGSVSGDLPSFTQPAGWQERLLAGTALMAQYSFAEGGAGPFVGVLASWMQWRIARTDAPDIEGERDQLVLAAAGGYTWFFVRGLYVQPMLGIGRGIFTHGTVTLAGETYRDKLPIAILPGLFVGYQWGR